MRRPSHRIVLVVMLALAVGLALGVSPYASASPDGLERVAADRGFADRAVVHDPQRNSPIPDYLFPGVEDERLATGLGGFAGTLLVAAFAAGIAEWARRRAPERA